MAAAEAAAAYLEITVPPSLPGLTVTRELDARRIPKRRQSKLTLKNQRLLNPATAAPVFDPIASDTFGIIDPEGGPSSPAQPEAASSSAPPLGSAGKSVSFGTMDSAPWTGGSLPPILASRSGRMGTSLLVRNRSGDPGPSHKLLMYFMTRDSETSYLLEPPGIQ